MRDRPVRLLIHMAYVYPLFHPGSTIQHGGAEVDVFLLAGQLAKRTGYAVDFLCGDFGQAAVETHETARLHRIRCLETPGCSGMRHKILRHGSLFSRLLFHPCDMLFTEGAGNAIGWMALIGKYVRRKPVVFRLASDADLDLEKQRRKGRLNDWLYRFGVRHCDVVIAQSEWQKEQLRKCFQRDSLLIRNGVSLAVAPGTVRAGHQGVRQELHQGRQQGLHLLWVSRAIKLKRPELFIALAKDLPEHAFTMIMPLQKATDPQEADALCRYRETLVESATDIANLTILDGVPYADIQRYYDDADAFVNTSEYEGFPNAFLQSCLGRTCILSLVVNPDQFITRHDLGHVCGDSLEDAMNWIRSTGKEAMRLMGDNAYAYVKGHHDIDKVTDAYCELFQSLL